MNNSAMNAPEKKQIEIMQGQIKAMQEWLEKMQICIDRLEISMTTMRANSGELSTKIEDMNKYMHDFVHEVRNNHTSTGPMLIMILEALKGNDVRKDGGMVGQIASMQTRIDNLEKNNTSRIEQDMPNKVYQKILWRAIGIILTAILLAAVGYLIAQFSMQNISIKN